MCPREVQCHLLAADADYYYQRVVISEFKIAHISLPGNTTLNFGLPECKLRFAAILVQWRPALCSLILH